MLKNHIVAITQVYFEMSDSESDIAFESADEGEELAHTPLRDSKNLNDGVNVERLHSPNEENNDEIEKCKNYKERTECNDTEETNICNEGTTISTINKISVDANSNRKISKGNDKELKIIEDTNIEIITDKFAIRDIDNNEDVTKLKQNENICISQKQAEVIEKLPNDDKKEKPEYLVKIDKNHLKCTDDSNKEKQDESFVKSVNKSKKEKSDRIVLNIEKKLSQKHKNVEKLEQKQEPVLDTSKEQQTSSSWGWGNWSSSLLYTAASSVTAFTSQVSEGIGTVLETVESTLGAPSPEELAAAIESRKKEANNHNETKIVNENEGCEAVMETVEFASNSSPLEISAATESRKEVNSHIETKVDNETDTSSNIHENSSGLLGVSSFSKVIESAGSKVLMTGLDTLELIGKTTIDILTEGDPGLRKKRAYFTDATNLSEVLREAKDKAEARGNVNSSDVKPEETVCYSTLFDNFQGIVHLEALEMLSRQNKSTLQGLLLSQVGEDLRKSKEIINELQEVCENLPAVDDTLDEESHHEFEYLIKDYISKLELDLNTTKLEEVHKNVHDWLKSCKKEQDKGEAKDAMELHNEALKSLAQLTARSMELFHKVAEMMLYKSPDIILALSCAGYLIDITGVLCFEVGIIAAKFCHCLNTAADDSEDPESVTPLITNVYLEASNSNTYIQDAFQLLIPLLQVVAINQIE